MNNSTPQSSSRKACRVLTLLMLTLLAACRMPVATNGEGVVYGEKAGQVYSNGYVFDIQEDFHETFWPVPAPGHSFRRWTKICRDQPGACEVQLDERLWGEDESIPLVSRYRPYYSGPLKLLDYDAFIGPGQKTLSVPLSSIEIEGLALNSTPRYFMATTDMRVIIPALKMGNELKFSSPKADYSVQDLVMFVSATDSAGTIASASFSFGLANRVSGKSLKPYQKNSPWAEVLAACASANDPFQLCPLETLPFLGSVSAEPDIDQILQRTTVTHSWMGDRFKQVLAALPPDMLKMFRGTTAIVISSGIRPAFYTSATGAIYLDPQDLWLTPAERETIDWEPDYRSEFGSTLKFISAELYVSGNTSAWRPSYLYEEGQSRTFDEIIWPIANLLIHELTHANDAMPPALLSDVLPDETVLEATYRLERLSPSLQLLNTYPLRSALLYDLGSVLFFGAPVTTVFQNLSAMTLGLEFEQDDASALYAYASPFEDTAMLVEEVLTHYYFGLDRVSSFLDVPRSDNPDCSEYTVQWGRINRVATPAIRERARLVLTGILDEADVSRYLDGVPSPGAVKRGLGLCDSLLLLPNKNRLSPGQFIAPPELARQHAMRARTHKEMRDRRNFGRTRISKRR